MPEARRYHDHAVCSCLLSALLLLAAGGCIDIPNPPDNGNGQTETNTTDPTNANADYIGKAACSSCHVEAGQWHDVHGHSQKLKKLSGSAPVYPPEGTRAGVPDPPDGMMWTDITYVIGGYYRKARFIDRDGYVMTDGVDGINTQWNLDFAPNGTVASWAGYLPDQATPKPYDFASCFVCHTTGPSADGLQDVLPGIQGTFSEPGVQCEACHGPGSNHPSNPGGGTIYINATSASCGVCHSRGGDMTAIPASDGYIRHHEQYQELLASPHASLRCATCHEPHISTAYDLDNAIINQCEACHPGKDMAIHEGKIYGRGSYGEVLSCESCHMTYATQSATAASEAVVGTDGRMGDIRTHIWSINTDNVDYTTMFSQDGSTVAVNESGRASVTLDFVCLRCHNGIGNAFDLSLRAASAIASDIHRPTE